jgi:hypothetical protein
VVIGGHGARGYSGQATSMRVQLADGLIYDTAFVANCFNQINNNTHGGSPVERVDLLMTMCYGGGLIDDFRNDFHALRGTTWPNASHLSCLTAGDGFDVTTGFMGVKMVQYLMDSNSVVDLDGDGDLSIYEFFEWSAKNDLTNPDLNWDPDYTPYIPETLYVPSLYYFPVMWNGSYLGEHPLYYEWNAPAPMMALLVERQLESQGHVELSPEPDDANQPRYPQGTVVLATAVPIQDRVFKHWLVYDPDHLDDANYAVEDSNNPLTVVMDRDRRIAAVFGCSNGVGQVLPPMLIGLLTIGVITRRARRRPF